MRCSWAYARFLISAIIDISVRRPLLESARDHARFQKRRSARMRMFVLIESTDAKGSL